MRVTIDHWNLRWLPIKLAAYLEGLPEPDYRRWLFKRLHWLDEAQHPLIRPVSMKVTPRHKHWQWRRDDWKYVHDSSLTPPARHRLDRLRAREFYIDEIPDGQEVIEQSLRVSIVEIALQCRLPGLLHIHIPARALDVRPCVPTRSLIANTARRVHLLHDAAAIRQYLMTFDDLKSTVSGKFGLPKTQADAMIRTVFSTIQDTLMGGDSITIPGFGTFATVKRAQRKCHHPKTGALIIVPAKVAPVFRPTSKLQEAVNR